MAYNRTRVDNKDMGMITTKEEKKGKNGKEKMEKKKEIEKDVNIVYRTIKVNNIYIVKYFIMFYLLCFVTYSFILYINSVRNKTMAMIVDIMLCVTCMR